MSRLARKRIRDANRRRGQRLLLAGLVVVLGVAGFLGVMELMDQAQVRATALGWDSPALSPAAESGRDSVTTMERVRVEVLNAGGMVGAARAATDELRDQGFDVVYYGNAPAFGRDTTLILDRTHWPEAAHRVADALEQTLGRLEVRTEPDSTLYVDVTVLLGKDWPEIPPVGRRP
ncbi:MAG: LytR C-terminal domain-containing protein [Gemmatimonadota bacterium]